MKEQPDLSERELSALLDLRDREQELKRRRLRRWVTVAVGTVVAMGLAAVFSFKESRELTMSPFQRCAATFACSTSRSIPSGGMERSNG